MLKKYGNLIINMIEYLSIKNTLRKVGKGKKRKKSIHWRLSKGILQDYHRTKKIFKVEFFLFLPFFFAPYSYYIPFYLQSI